MNRFTAFALAALATTVGSTAPSFAAIRAAGPQNRVAVTAVAPVSLDLRQIPGSFHLAVSGKALASTPIVLTLLGTVSSEIPDIVVSRRTVVPDYAGNFKFEVPVAGDYFAESYLTLVATSPSGAVLAKSPRLVLKAPNTDVSVPIEAALKAES